MSRTTEHLERKGVPFEASVHQQTYRTIDEARALGIDADEVVKTLLLDTRSGHAVAVIPGDRRLDMRFVERAVGDRRARLATEEEIQRDLPDYELGCLPPLGSLLGMPTYVDPGVTKYETVVFAAGSQTESVKVRTEHLFRDEPVTVVQLTRGGEDEGA
jgi:Cys-tRNA(Pro) deacylase